MAALDLLEGCEHGRPQRFGQNDSKQLSPPFARYRSRTKTCPEGSASITNPFSGHPQTMVSRGYSEFVRGWPAIVRKMSVDEPPGRHYLV